MLIICGVSGIMLHWSNDITVYHRTTSSNGRVSWTRSVYKNCFWKSQSGTTGWSAAADTATKRVRISGSANVSVGDIVILGVVNDTIDEYTQGSRSTDIKKAHPESITVTGVRRNAGTGRLLPHICIDGA